MNRRSFLQRAFGGAVVSLATARFGFPLVHVKDMDSTPRHFFTEVGQGTIDFKKIFAAAQKAGVKQYFVEQDETPASPF